jgi:hypothetical protein
VSAPKLRYGNVTPAMADGGNTSVQTAAAGANYADFPAQEMAQLTIINDTGTDLEWLQDDAGVALPIASGENFTIFGVDDASRISVRRKDQSNTQVTVKARWER